MNYARQASRNLFIESGLRDSWRDYLSTASYIQGEIERHLGAIRERQVLFERQGRMWNTPPSREEGEEVSATLGAGSKGLRFDLDNDTYIPVPGVGVRLLTPTEQERLQGFPDGWTAGQSDTVRYKQIGNAVAVPCAEWIGKQLMRLQ